MLKKTLLSAAVASSFALSGCLDDSPSTTENAGSVTNPPVANGVFPIFSPSEAKFPVPNDLLYSSETAGDGTFVDLGVPNPLPPYSASEYNPVTAALGGLSGASTVAPIDIAMSGLIDPASLKGQSDGAEQNVFLIALEYASGSPVQGLSIGEPPQAASSQPTFEIEHKVLDGNSTIRINPTSVLEPLTRYIVVVKNTITDQAGESIIKSPGAAGYEALTDETNPLSGSLAALQPVQALINGLWEPIAIAGIPVIDSDADIALTYSFTTSGDEKVLNYIAEPNLWFNDQITRFVGVSTATAIVTDQTDLNMDGKVDYTDVNLATQGALAAFPINPSDPTDTTVADALAPLQAGFGLLPAPCPGLTPDGTNGVAYINCISGALVALPSGVGGFADLLPTPKAAEIDFTGSTPVTHPGYANVSIVQGTMKVPYYSRPPADIGAPNEGENIALGTGAPIKYLSWEADNVLATAINTAFQDIGLVLPQADPAITTAVNYIFPFPKKQDADVTTPADYSTPATVASTVEDMTIPITIAYPNGITGANVTPMKTMIMGHGLGGSRSIALGATGSGLVASADTATVGTLGFAAFDLAVVAIDQPLHGLQSDAMVDPDNDSSTDNDVTVLTKTDSERHFGYADAGSGLPPKELTEEDNTSLLFVNVESFLTTRDNNRQNALDLMALRKAIGGIDLTGMSGSGTDLDGSDVYYQGYSLGTISAQATVAVANGTVDTNDDFKSAFFSTPGGGIARFFESSPAFAGNIVDGLAAAGLTSDTANYQAFLNTIQASVDAFDAINFVGDYEAQGTKVLYYTASNDQVIPVSQVPGRTLQTPAGTLAASEINASVSYLSGAEPLLIEANIVQADGATDFDANNFAIEDPGAVTVNRNVIRFKPGAGSHGGPCPVIDDEAATLARATEFGGYALGMLNPTGGGTIIQVSTTTVSDAIDAAPIEPFFIDALQCSPASS